MTSEDDLTWEEAIRRGQAALLRSEQLEEALDAGAESPDGREQLLRRAELYALRATGWFALARELASDKDRYGGN